MALAALRSLGSRVRPDVFYRSDFSHPISHRTPHYRVGNGGIRWMVISQKPLNFWIKRHCKIQDKMVCNGLGNRCSILLRYWAALASEHNRSSVQLLGRA